MHPRQNAATHALTVSCLVKACQNYATPVLGIKTAVWTSDVINSALHPSGVAKSSTSFSWGKGGKVTAAGWQVTLCDPIWHVISRSGVIFPQTAISALLYLLTGLTQTCEVPPIKFST